jgi:hypothetical protein
MANIFQNLFRIKRRTAGSAGAPPSLTGGELAFNEVDGSLYYGKTDLSISSIAGQGKLTTLSTTQTISGDKTFTSNIVLSAAEATTPSVNANNTVVATTEFVQNVFSVIDGGYFDGDEQGGVGFVTILYSSPSSSSWSNTSNWYTPQGQSYGSLPISTDIVGVSGTGNLLIDLDTWTAPQLICVLANTGHTGLTVTSQQSATFSMALLSAAAGVTLVVDVSGNATLIN